MSEELSVIVDMSLSKPTIITRINNIVVSSHNISREEWYTLQKKTTIPPNTKYIVCITPEQEECKHTFASLESILENCTTPKDAILACARYTDYNGIPMYTMDKTSAVLLGLACKKHYYELSMWSGIILIYAGEYRTLVISMYQGKVCGAFGFCSALIEEQEVLYALEQFKNRWLPEEEIQDMGGCGSIFSGDIPEEAIFSATYCIGFKTKKYESSATILPYTLSQESIETSSTILGSIA